MIISFVFGNLKNLQEKYEYGFENVHCWLNINIRNKMIYFWQQKEILYQMI